MTDRGKAPGMKVIEDFPENETCPVCNTNNHGYALEVVVQGWNTMQPVHLACCVPQYYNVQLGMLYRLVERPVNDSAENVSNELPVTHTDAPQMGE
jgi:hypothetical protein